MIASPAVNPIYFKRIVGSYPNEENTLHNTAKCGNMMVVKYWQKINNGDTVLLQFHSDSSTIPTIKLFNGAIEIEEITATLDYTATGVDTIYYYSFIITFDTNYYDKCISAIVYQDSDILTSEAIFITDLTELINSGVIKKFEYTNSNRLNSDLANFGVDWEHLPMPKKMFCYFDGILLNIKDEDNSEILKGAMNHEMVSASLFIGNTFKSDILPRYMVTKLEAVSSLEYLTINDVRFTKIERASCESVEKTTSYKIEIQFIRNDAIGINMDLAGGLIDMTSKEWIKFDIKTGVTGNYSVHVPAGYDFHMLTAKHGYGSSHNNATVICGNTVGGTEYFDAIGGEITYPQPFSFTPHDRFATTIYVGVSGVGVNLDIVMQFLRKQPFE